MYIQYILSNTGKNDFQVLQDLELVIEVTKNLYRFIHFRNSAEHLWDYHNLFHTVHNSIVGYLKAPETNEVIHRTTVDIYRNSKIGYSAPFSVKTSSVC